MEKKLKQKTWKRFLIQLTLLTLLFVILFGYFECSGFKANSKPSVSAAAAADSSEGNNNSKKTPREWKSIFYLKSSVCPVYQQIHATAAYKTIDGALRAGLRHVLKQSFVVDARISLQKLTKSVKNSRAFQTAKETSEQAYEVVGPVLLEAFTAAKTVSYRALKVLVRDVLPTVQEKTSLAWNTIVKSDAVKTVSVTIQKYYKDRVQPIYKESIEPLINKALVQSGASEIISLAYSRAQNVGSVALGKVATVFEDEITYVRGFYQGLLV